LRAQTHRERAVIVTDHRSVNQVAAGFAEIVLPGGTRSRRAFSVSDFKDMWSF
jgi:hypothetical protein